MSILLKDIPTPKEPTPITIYPDGRWYDYTDGTHGTWTKLPKKHGRLIDAFKLLRALIRKEPFSDCARVVIAECMEEIRQAQTIVEAEGE